LNIAICDDDKNHREDLHSIIKCCDILREDAAIFEYPSGSALIEGHVENRHDIIFLDIQMDGMNGLETAHEIRSGDRDAIIIFLTGHEQHVMQSFRIEPFDYIVKPADEYRISDVLNRALRKYNDLHYIVDFKCGNDVHTLDVVDIVYIESYKRKLKVVTANPDETDYEIHGKLDNYDKQLQKYGFLRCHHSFLINMRYIKVIENTQIKTKTGHSVHMSTRKKQICLQSFNTFITKYKVR